MHKQNCPKMYGCLVIHEDGICPERQKPCTCYGNGNGNLKIVVIPDVSQRFSDDIFIETSPVNTSKLKNINEAHAIKHPMIITKSELENMIKNKELILINDDGSEINKINI